MTPNTPTPDVAATREAANKYAAVFLRWERVPHGKGVKAELDAAEAAVEAAARDACVRHAINYGLALMEWRGCERRTKTGTCVDKGFEVRCFVCNRTDELKALAGEPPS